MSAQPKPSSESPDPARRKRGGQPGNSNAFKHGFYTQNFSRTEVKGLQAIQGVVLGDEIKLLRVLIKRFADQIEHSNGVALPESAHCLAVISEAMLRLGTLLRTDHLLGGSESSTLIKELNLALAGIAEEMVQDQA
jgi:hypothetical protein